DALSYGNVFVELSQQFNFWNDFAHTRMPAVLRHNRSYLPRTLRRGEKHLECTTNDAFNILDDGRDSFLIRDFPFGRYEDARRQLYGLKFVETRREALSELAGPLMQASSPYLKDFGKVIIDGVMFGLYARAGSLEEFKAGYSRSQNSVLSETERTLTLHDLRPYFLAWATGIGLGLLVFLVEVAQFCYSRSRSRNQGRHRRPRKSMQK
ncbi:hypothetical protein HPB47_026055, partial [Ixodes persulcatus]